MAIEIGAYLINPLSVFLAVIGFGGILISLYLFQYKKSPGTGYLALMQLFTALWAFFYCLEYASTDLELKLFWSKLSYLGIAFTPVWFYFFSLRFINSDRNISRKLKTGLIIAAIAFILIVLTNDYHHLHWESATIDTENNTTIYKYGIFFWLIFVFIYTLLTLSIRNILRLLKQVPDDFQISVWLIISACFVPVAGNFMYVFKVNPIPGFDWTPVCFLASGTILAYINIRFGTFELVPFARKMLIDIMDDAILLTDQQHRVADFNPALMNLLSKNRKELIGKELIEVFPQRKDLIRKVTTLTQPMQMEITTELSPVKKHLDMQITPLFDKKNNLSGKLIVFRDITDRVNFQSRIIFANNELKKQIIEKEKLIADLDAFAHTVAHDLRDSIGAIVSSTDLIQYDIENQDYTSALEINSLICTSANKTLHVIKELLTMSTIRQEDIRTEKVDMGKVIEESEKRLQEIIQESDAKILRPEKWPVVKAHPSWLEEVWVNYIGNAIKYGGKPPVLELGAEQLYSENKVKFWVKDNGMGLTPEEQNQLFTKFIRLETVPVQGTGLGLSIVKRIIEKLGGEVGVFSNAIPGEGCLFYFTLPDN